MATKPTLLLVDDEERILRSLKMIFRGKYNVFTTTDGYEAVEIVKQNTVHVVISDQRMPKIPGVEVLKKIREISPHTIRILLTGYSELTSIVGSINDGEIYRFINKPWDRNELLATVEQAAGIAMKCMNEPEDKTKQTGESAASVNIMVIDEDKETSLKINTIKPDNVNIIDCYTFETAMHTLTQKNIAIVIADVNFADGQIAETLTALKQQAPHIISIVLSSHQDANMLIKLINQGQIFRCLPKPAKSGLLKQSIASAIQRYESFLNNPTLISRHNADPEKPENTPKKSSGLLGYLSRIRERQALDSIV